MRISHSSVYLWASTASWANDPDKPADSQAPSSPWVNFRLHLMTSLHENVHLFLLPECACNMASIHQHTTTPHPPFLDKLDLNLWASSYVVLRKIFCFIKGNLRIFLGAGEEEKKKEEEKRGKRKRRGESGCWQDTILGYSGSPGLLDLIQRFLVAAKFPDHCVLVWSG